MISKSSFIKENWITIDDTRSSLEQSLRMMNNFIEFGDPASLIAVSDQTRQIARDLDRLIGKLQVSGKN